jgi:hypothetical protein
MEEFRGPILSGRKTVTTRSKKYGEPGDVLDTPFGRVRLVKVEKATLGQVRDILWYQEGVESPEAFERVWASIHPGRGFRPDDVRFVHQFEVVA